MEIVIYRDKKTKEITRHHEKTIRCTPEALEIFNSNPKCEEFVEFVDLGQNELAKYFYELKTKSIEREAEALRELEDDLRDLADQISDRLCDFDRLFEGERKNEE